MRRLALALLLTLGACAPKAADQAEICALLAQPAIPGMDAIGDGRAMDALDKRLQRAGRIFGPEWMGGPVRYWGRCPHVPETVQMVLLDRESRFAALKGGPRDHGMQRRFGTCFYQKDETRWRLLACRINGAS